MIKVWLQAFRLRTLPLAMASVGMGAFLAASQNSFKGEVLLWTLLTTVFLQILSNLANDYGDTLHGADSEERAGPSRAVQSGAITKSAMKVAIGLFVLLSFGSGLYLLNISVGFTSQTFWLFLGLGIASIIAAMAYTMGKKPYGYAGLGDLSVLLFFGLVAVLGSYYLHTGFIQWEIALPATSLGLFSVAVLNINNIRDIESDKLAGKNSIPVRIGRTAAIKYHWVILIMGLGASVVYTALNFASFWQLVFIVATLPLLIRNGLGVTRNEEANQLDPFLKQMALTTLLFVLTFGIGLLIR